MTDRPERMLYTLNGGEEIEVVPVAEVDRLRAGISWARGMLTDTEPHENVDAFLGRLLREETR